jgi:hypothetical protein
MRLGGQSALPPDAIDDPVASRRYKPGSCVGWGARARPLLCSDRERFLGGLFGKIEVAAEADQRSDDITPVLAKDLLENRYRSTMGRTSIAPPIRAAGIRAATSIAASRSSASKNR